VIRPATAIPVTARVAAVRAAAVAAAAAVVAALREKNPEKDEKVMFVNVRYFEKLDYTFVLLFEKKTSLLKTNINDIHNSVSITILPVQNILSYLN